MSKAKLETNMMARDQDSRADLFLMHEGLNKPVERESPVAPTMTDSRFVADFHKHYSRIPATYRKHPVDQATEIIKTGVLAQILDELRSLMAVLKSQPKPTT
jgi:hypothetical protein